MHPQSDSSAYCQEFDIMTQHNISISESNSSVKNSEEYEFRSYSEKEMLVRSVFIWSISIIEVPAVLITLFALCFLIKSRRAASVFVIHLLLSDLIQIICLIILSLKWTVMLWNAYIHSLIAGMYFMACIAFERYLLVCHPHWYKTYHSLKSIRLLSLIVWFVPLIFWSKTRNHVHLNLLRRSIASWIPYPVIIVCFVATRRGLSHAISLTSQKRKMILGSLFLVLINYTLVILPHSVTSFYFHVTNREFVRNLAHQKLYNCVTGLLFLNPLADCLLYLFMRSDVADIMRAFHCRC